LVCGCAARIGRHDAGRLYGRGRISAVLVVYNP